MSWLPTMMLCIGFVILCGGVANLISKYAESRYGEGASGAIAGDEVNRRLDEVEKRLSDVLDVMIALSEKFDHWEGEEHPKIPSSV